MRVGEMTAPEVQALLDQIRSGEKLSEEDFIKKCLTDMLGGWVPLAMYLQMFPTETKNAIYKRVQQGAWQRQVHYAAPKGGGAWVNLPAVKAWVLGLAESPSWCCEEGERLQVPVCPTCAEASAAYQRAMGPEDSRTGG